MTNAITTDEDTDKLQKKYEEDHHRDTIQWYLEREASLRKDIVTVDEDDFGGLVRDMEAQAWKWARATYPKLTPNVQRTMKPGMAMRFDLLDRQLQDEIADLLGSIMDNWGDAGPSSAQPDEGPPRQFRPV